MDVVIFDNELSPAQLREIEARVQRKVLDRTQLILDIFARRARTREGKLAGRARAAAVPAAATGWLRHGAVAAGRRHRHARSWRNEARNRSAAHPARAFSRSRERHRRGAAPARAAARAAPEAVVPDGGARRLHERRQDHPVQPADDGRRPRRPTRCSSRSIPSSAACACRTAVSCSSRTRSASSIACRIRWWRRSAPRSRKSPRPTSCCTSSMRPAPIARGAWPRSCGARGDRRRRRRALDVYNKCDLLDPSELRRLRQADPAALCVSAIHRGRAWRVDRDNHFTPGARRAPCHAGVRRARCGSPERVARVYRHARVLRHVTLDGRVSIDADVPRRALPRLQEAPPP